MSADRRAVQRRTRRRSVLAPEVLGPLWRWTCRQLGPDGGRCKGSGLADCRGAASVAAVEHIEAVHAKPNSGSRSST